MNFGHTTKESNAVEALRQASAHLKGLGLALVRLSDSLAPSPVLSSIGKASTGLKNQEETGCEKDPKKT